MAQASINLFLTSEMETFVGKRDKLFPIFYGNQVFKVVEIMSCESRIELTVLSNITAFHTLR